MLRRQRQFQLQIQRVLDASLFAIAFFVSHWLRNFLPPVSDLAKAVFNSLGGTDQIQGFNEYVWYFVLTIPVSLLFLGSVGFYNRQVISSRRMTWWQLLKVCTYTSLSLVVITFLMKDQPSRAVLILFGFISFGLMVLKEELMRTWLLSTLGQHQLETRLILVGSEEDRKNVREEILQRSEHGITIKAELDVNQSSVEELVELLHEHSANGVLLSAAHTFFGKIEKVIQACELEGVQVWLVANFFKTQISQTTVDDFYGHPMLVFRSTPEYSWQGMAKRSLDFVGSLALLILLAFPILAIAIAIRLSSPGPVLFRQKRSGLNGHPFTMYKFRSMVTNAEQKKDELAQFNEMEGPVFKVSNDPRITRIGKFLRKYSLDELPQLYNVLVGEMSLVGPRPLPVDETRQFNDLAHRRRLSVKPGLTCLWQISGRNEVTDFKEWVRLDLEYIDNWSIWLDLKILLETVPVVFTGAGAK